MYNLTKPQNIGYHLNMSFHTKESFDKHLKCSSHIHLNRSCNPNCWSREYHIAADCKRNSGTYYTRL